MTETDNERRKTTRNRVEWLYPSSYEDPTFLDLCAAAVRPLAAAMPGAMPPRVPGWTGPDGYADLLERYDSLPSCPSIAPADLVGRIAEDFLAGAINWRSADLQYNLGAAVNGAASAVYAAALDVNVYLINDGLAGNAVIAEQAVSRILAQLSGVNADTARGVFTFGGTGTMAYAIKAGIRKCAPDSVRHGVPDDVCVAITEDAHFSHETAADWLGVGSDQLVTFPALADRRSDLHAAESLLRERLESGARLATIIVNGGTTYDHAVDDIRAFADLRNRLVADYGLRYRPHLHVDSVVGWVWLMLRGADLTPNALGVAPDTAGRLALQYERIVGLRHADSWGVDFHKGVGGCPVDCSFVQFNDRADLFRLRRGGVGERSLHQLAEDYSDVSPVDYTMETSRAGGKALAALACLHSLGSEGYRRILADLLDAAMAFRANVEREPGMWVLNPHALGYQTMVRLEPGANETRNLAHLVSSVDASASVEEGNRYLRAFFSWDNETRMNVNGGGVVYSYSAQYVRTAARVPLAGLKFYPTSPAVGLDEVDRAVVLLAARKAEFERDVWRG